MVKKFIKLFFICLLFLSFFNYLFSSNDEVKFYKIKIRLCKQIRDFNCELKYYSYLYDIADNNLKKSIEEEVSNILKNITELELKKIKLNLFKKNWVYYCVLNKLQPSNKNQFLKKTKSTIKVVGLLIPLSGEYKFIGKNILKGVLASINFFTSSDNLKIKIFDTESGKNDIINKFINFIETNADIQILIGPVLKKSSNLLVEQLKTTDKPVIFLNDYFNLARYSKTFFNHFININDEMEKLCDVIAQDSINSLAILYPDNILGYKYKNAFFKNCNVSTIKVILKSYYPEEVDFKNILFEIGKIEKIKKNIYEPKVQIDGFLILDRLEKALSIIPQIYFYDFDNPKIYGIDLWNNKKLYYLDKKFLKNITFVDCIDYNSQNPLKKIYNKNIDFYTILAYDTITIIKQISGDIISNLHNKKFSLISGETYFDEYGISHKNMIIFNIGGKNDKEKR